MNRLIGLMGGPDKFSKRLDAFFADGFHVSLCFVH